MVGQDDSSASSRRIRWSSRRRYILIGELLILHYQIMTPPRILLFQVRGQNSPLETLRAHPSGFVRHA